MKKAPWKRFDGMFGGYNLVLDRGGHYISFNPNPCSGLSFFASDSGGAETALVKDGEYYILNGDFRKDYEKLKTFAACKKFFDKHKAAHKSSWSTDAVA